MITAITLAGAAPVASSLSILGTSVVASLQLAEGFRPFITPFPGAWNFWYLLIIPLCMGVSIVYKATKCSRMAEVPRQAATICLWILLAMSAGAALLVVIVKVREAMIS